MRLRALAEKERRRRERERRIQAWYADPAALCAAVGFEPDAWQRDVLAPMPAGSMAIWTCGRQTGKSSCAALLCVRELLKPDSLTLLAAPSLRQSRELFRKVLHYWRLLSRPVPHVAVTTSALELQTRSRLIALPGAASTIRGFSAPSLIVIDESAGCSDDLFSAISPMAATSSGVMVLLSSPMGKRGFHWELWSLPPEADPTIRRTLVPTSACPRVPAGFLEREQRRLPWNVYASEYDCQFLDAVNAAFRESDILAAVSDDINFDKELFAE